MLPKPAPEQQRIAYIDYVPPEEAQGGLARAYEEVRAKRGEIANLFIAQSLRPDTILSHLDMYMTLMFAESGLSRCERESIAVVVSAANSCAYCVQHHAEALSKLEKDQEAVQRLGRGEIPETLPPRTRALAHYARKLTKQAFAVEEADVEALREIKFGEEEILTANLIASYYNFVNRFVDGLGILMETEKRRYKY